MSSSPRRYLPSSPVRYFPSSPRRYFPSSPRIYLPSSPRRYLQSSPRTHFPSSQRRTFPCSPRRQLPSSPMTHLPSNPWRHLPSSPRRSKSTKFHTNIISGDQDLCQIVHILHFQILVPCMFRSVSPRLEDNDTLKCHSDHFAQTLRYLVIMEKCQNYIQQPGAALQTPS